MFSVSNIFWNEFWKNNLSADDDMNNQDGIKKSYKKGQRINDMKKISFYLNTSFMINILTWLIFWPYVKYNMIMN